MDIFVLFLNKLTVLPSHMGTHTPCFEDLPPFLEGGC